MINRKSGPLSVKKWRQQTSVPPRCYFSAPTFLQGEGHWRIGSPSHEEPFIVRCEIIVRTHFPAGLMSIFEWCELRCESTNNIQNDGIVSQYMLSSLFDWWEVTICIISMHSQFISLTHITYWPQCLDCWKIQEFYRKHSTIFYPRSLGRCPSAANNAPIHVLLKFVLPKPFKRSREVPRKFLHECHPVLSAKWTWYTWSYSICTPPTTCTVISVATTEIQWFFIDPVHNSK